MSRQLRWHKGLLVGRALGDREFYIWVPRECTEDLMRFAVGLLDCNKTDNPVPIDALQRYFDYLRVTSSPRGLGLGDDGEGPYAPGRPTTEALISATKGPVDRVAHRVAKKPKKTKQVGG